MSRLARIEATYLSRIRDAATRFGDHEEMSPGRVLKWMSQFSDAHLGLASKILSKVTYYAASNIRSMTRQLVEIVLDEMRDVPQNKIIFVPVGDPGGGSNVIARVLRALRSPVKVKVVSMSELEKLDPDQVSVIVFVDDFSGTGGTLSTWWETVEPIVLPKKAKIAVALLVMNSRAREKIEEFSDCVLCVEELSENRNVLSSSNTDFPASEKMLLLDYARKTGSSQDYVQGFGSCGLLLAFKHGCPNNSLPILWHDCPRWQALFSRHAI